MNNTEFHTPQAPHKLFYSAIYWNRKPTSEEIAKELQRSYWIDWSDGSGELIQNYLTADSVSVDEFAQLCCDGHTWRAAIYDVHHLQGYKMKKWNAVENWCLALDFDECGHSPWEVVEFAKKIGWTPNFFYFTHSQDPIAAQELVEKLVRSHLVSKYNISRWQGRTDQKTYKEGWNFRIVWSLGEALDPALYEDTERFLLNQFHDFNPDENCFNCDRLWHGGHTYSVVINEDYFTIPTTIDEIEEKIAVDGQKPSKVMRGKKRTYDREIARNQVVPEAKVGSNWMEQLLEPGRCELFEKWANQETTHKETYKLALNLGAIERADHNTSILQDVSTFYDPSKHDNLDMDEFYRFMRDSNSCYIPAIVRTDFGRLVSIPEFFANYANNSIRTLGLKKQTLEELDAAQPINQRKFLKGSGLGVYEVQTGSGKTAINVEFLTKEFDITNSRIIYSCSNHSTAKEFYDRLLEALPFEKRGYVYRGPRVGFTPTDEIRMRLGLAPLTKDTEKVKYFHNLYNEEVKGVFIMTHARFSNIATLFKENLCDLVLIDEDPLSAIYTRKFITPKQLRTIAPYCGDAYQDVLNLVEEIKNNDAPSGYKVSLTTLRTKILPAFTENIEDYLNDFSGYKELIPEGLFSITDNAKAYLDKENGMETQLRIKKENHVIQSALVNNVPVRIFSATPAMEVLTQLYGSNIEHYKEPLTQNKGKVINYCGMAFGRGKKEDRGDRLEKFREFIKCSLPESVWRNTLIITYKLTDGQIKEFEDDGFRIAKTLDESGNLIQVHFDNNAGLDCFKGQNIIVLGKPDLPLREYRYMWEDFGDGTPFAKEDGGYAFQRVMTSRTVGNITINVSLFQNEMLRRIQEEHITASITQAVGRARTLREEGATVYLFTDYIVPIADELHYGFTEIEEEN